MDAEDTIPGVKWIIMFLFIFCVMPYIVFSDDIEDRESSLIESPGILISVFPREPVVGDELEIVGQIPLGIRLDTEHDIIISSQKPGTGGFIPCADTVPDSEGYFSASCTPDISGEWRFRALYCGVASQTAIIVVSHRQHPAQSYLTLHAWPLDPMVGETVSFTGRLTGSDDSGIAGKTISRYVAKTPACVGFFGRCGYDDTTLSWQRFGSSRTGSDGSYSFSLPVVEEGNVAIRTIFNGDDSTSPARSTILYFSV